MGRFEFLFPQTKPHFDVFLQGRWRFPCDDGRVVCPNKVVCWWAQHICKAKDEEHHKNLEDPVACNSGGFNFVSSCVSFRVNWMYSSWAQIGIASVAQQESQVLYLVGCQMLIVLCSFQPHLALGIQLAWCPKFWSMPHFAILCPHPLLSRISRGNCEVS